MSFGSPYARWFHAVTSYAPGRASTLAPGASAPYAPPARLPAPALPDVLIGMLQRRFSCRSFASTPLEAERLGDLLHAGYGVLESRERADGDAPLAARAPQRMVPSAGACYPLHLYVLARSVAGVDPGAYYYDPRAHGLIQVGSRPHDRAIAEVFLQQPYVASAAAILVMTAELEATASRYADRGYRYVLLEAGHVAQNIALCAAAEGIGNLDLGGFLDGPLAQALQLQGLPAGAGAAPELTAALPGGFRENSSQVFVCPVVDRRARFHHFLGAPSALDPSPLGHLDLNRQPKPGSCRCLGRAA